MKTSLTHRQIEPEGPEGFSLLELLSVIAILAVLAALLVPAVARMQKRGQQAESLSDLRQLSTGLLAVATDDGGLLPAPYEGAAGAASSTWDWVVGSRMGESFATAAALRQSPDAHTLKVFQCPAHKPVNDYSQYSKSRRSYSMGSRYWISGNTLTAETERVALSRISRPSETILVMEAFLDSNLRGMASRAGVNPVNIPGDNASPLHKKPYEVWNGGFQAAMFDGHIQFFKYTDFLNAWQGLPKSHGGWNYFSLGDPRIP